MRLAQKRFLMNEKSPQSAKDLFLNLFFLVSASAALLFYAYFHWHMTDYLWQGFINFLKNTWYR